MFKRWLYYLLDKDGRSYYVESDIVSTSASPRPLEDTPDGWQEIAIGYERDARLGIVRSFTLPISFVRAITVILRTIVFTKNTEEQVFLLIQRLTWNVTLTLAIPIYRYFYKGQLDLVSYRYKDIEDTAGIVEGGITKQVKANEATTYEIDIDSDPEVVKVKMDGIFLHQTANYTVPEITSGPSLNLPIIFLSKDGTAPYIYPKSQDQTQPAPDFFIKNVGPDPVSVELKGSLRFTANIYSQEVHIILFKSDGTTFTILQQDDFDPADQALHVVNYNQNVVLNENEFLHLRILVVQVVGDIQNNRAMVTFQETTFTAKYKARYKTTFINALKLSTVLKRLTEKITGSASNCDTTFVEQYDHLVLTSGDGNRGLTGAKVKISLNIYSNFLRMVAAAGQGIENGKILFNEYSYFLNPNDPIQLGEVKGLEVSPARDYLYNTVKAGYPAQEIADVNGKASFNNTNEYTSPSTGEVKQLDLTTAIISDAYYIEINRINLEGKTTTDDTADNQVFVLNVKKQDYSSQATFGQLLQAGTLVVNDVTLIDFFPVGGKFTIAGSGGNDGTYTVATAVVSGGVILIFIQGLFPFPGISATVSFTFSTYILRRVVYDNITGIPDPDTIFNIEDLTPRRIMNKQAQFINSVFYGFAGKKLTYQTNDKNADLITEKAGVIITERSDVLITSDIIFKPWYFEFDTKVPADLVDILEATPNRCFSFEWYGNTYKGFLIKAGISPNDNKSQSYKLLCSPDTDLTKLIKR